MGISSSNYDNDNKQLGKKIIKNEEKILNHKLGQKPNSLKTLEEKIKKQQVDEEKIKKQHIDEEKIKKQHIDEEKNILKYKLGQKPNSLKIFEEILKKKDEKKIKNNIIDSDKSNIITDNNIINNNIMNNKIIKPEIIKQKLLNINNFYNNDDNDDNNDDDNIRKPIPTITDILIGNDTDEFEKFKYTILSDKLIDNDMKQIIIQSRKEEIEKFDKKSKKNIENAIRSSIIAPLIIRIKDINYNKINLNQKEYLIQQINKWVDENIQIIKLESDTLYEVYELIDMIKIIRSDIDEEKLKNIFKPKNYDDFVCFVDTIEIIKTQSIKEEHERINKKLEKKRLEEKEEEEKNIQIKIRQNLLEILILNLNKLCTFDIQIKSLKKELELPINRFIELETENIELEKSLGEKINKFINSIRIIKENKEKLLNLIKII